MTLRPLGAFVLLDKVKNEGPRGDKMTFQTGGWGLRPVPLIHFWQVRGVIDSCGTPESLRNGGLAGGKGGPPEGRIRDPGRRQQWGWGLLSPCSSEDQVRCRGRGAHGKVGVHGAHPCPSATDRLSGQAEVA